MIGDMRRRDGVITHLRGSTLFTDCSAREVAAVARAGTVLDLQPGVHVVRQGCFDRDIYLVLDGTLDVERDGERVATLGDGSQFGELAFFAKAARNATVVARTHATVLVIPATHIRGLLLDVPTLALRLLEGVSTRLHQHDVARPPVVS